MLKGKTRLLLSILSLVALAGLVFVLAAPVKTEAALTGNASPSVNVTAGGSLALSNTTNVQWGDAAAGDTKTGTLNCTLSCNVTTYNVKVAKNQDLTSGSYTIPSSAFTYTTSYNSGTPSSELLTNLLLLHLLLLQGPTWVACHLAQLLMGLTLTVTTPLLFR